MTDALSVVIVAAISAVSAVLAAIITSRSAGKISNVKLTAELDNMKEIFGLQLTSIRQDILELSKHVDKHNNVIERTYKLEKDVSLVSERVNQQALTFDAKLSAMNSKQGGTR